MDASKRIDQAIAELLPDWRGNLLARLRAIVLKADPGIVEEWKWSSPVWSDNGLICSANAFKGHVGMNFFRGASLTDPKGVFNSGLDAKNTRTIKFVEGDRVDEAAIRDLVKAAAKLNTAG